MDTLGKILEEIKAASRKMVTVKLPLKYYRAIGTRKVEEIIRRYLEGEDAGTPENSRWIPVEERLPENGETALCTDGQDIYLVEYDADWDAPFGDMDGIIAWQPLPEPYRPEEL